METAASPVDRGETVASQKKCKRCESRIHVREGCLLNCDDGSEESAGKSNPGRVQMRLRHGIYVLAGILAMACSLQAADVTVDLGASAQNFVEYGVGDNGSGYANGGYNKDWPASLEAIQPIRFQAATPDDAGVYGGTYEFLTNILVPLPYPAWKAYRVPQVVVIFYFEYLAPGTTITLDLDETGGPDYVIPIYAGGAFVNGYNVTDTSSACSGTAVAFCDPWYVGEQPGAIFSSPVTGLSTFATTTATTAPEPSSLALAGIGIFGIVGMLWADPRKLFQS